MPLTGADLLGRIGQMHAGSTKHGAWIATTKGRKRLDLLNRLMGELTEGAFGVDTDFSYADGAGAFTACVFTKGRSKSVNPGRVNLESSRRGMSTKAQQVRRTLAKCSV